MPFDAVDEAMDDALAQCLDIPVVPGNISPAKAVSKGVGKRGPDKSQRQ
jgi:hypothetical protein